MTLYKQRIPTVDAVQFVAGSQNQFVTKLATFGVTAVYEPATADHPEWLRIENPDGTTLYAAVGDFVVRENSEYYTMASADFLALYEKV